MSSSSPQPPCLSNLSYLNLIQTYSKHNAKMIHQSAFAIHKSAPGTPDVISSNGMLTSPLPLFLGGFLGSVMACAKCKDLVYELTKMIKGSEKSYHLMKWWFLEMIPMVWTHLLVKMPLGFSVGRGISNHCPLGSCQLGRWFWRVKK